MSADSTGKTKTGRDAGRLTPGVHLRAEIQRLGLDQVAVSKATGVSRQTVNNVINGRQAISRAMAGKLGRLLGQSSDYWLGEWFPVQAGMHRPANMQGRTTGAGLLVNHQILRAVQDGVIGIEPFAAHNVQAASIDLSLSDILITAGGDRVSISRDKGFVLKPDCSINATTKERVELPRDYLGRLGAAARLASFGILTANAFHIEAGFKGRVSFCLFNAGASPFRLRPLDPVLSLEIVRLGATPDDNTTT
jgi:deoxycytidine triphosphate deaminase/addiction module HigA family antidote